VDERITAIGYYFFSKWGLMKHITAAALAVEPSAVEGDMVIFIAEIPAVLFELVGTTVRSEIH
jgi:hypothetical protein